MLTEGISPSPCVPHPSAGDSFSALPQEFPALTSPVPKDGSAQHEVVHPITTTGSLVHAQPRRLPPEHLQAAKQEFEHMLDLSIIRLPLARWLYPSTWFQRMPWVTGDHVGITAQ